MSRYLVYASLLGGAAAMTWGFATKDHFSPAIGVALLGVLWMVAYLRGLMRVTGWAFALFTVISILGIWAGVSAWLSFAGLTCSLIAWDLTAFDQRLQMSTDQHDRRKMESAHLVRLGLVVALALLGYVIAPRLHVSLTFGGAALLALLGIWGISALVYRLRSHE